MKRPGEKRVTVHTDAVPRGGIRRAALDDIGALMAIENASFPGNRLDRRRFRYLLTQANSIVLVDAQGDTVRGYILVLLRADSRSARVYSVATHPAHMGRGVAARLVDAAERLASARGCTSIRLEIRNDNTASLALFRARGYVQFGGLRAYYHDGADALRLRIYLTGTQPGVVNPQEAPAQQFSVRKPINAFMVSNCAV
jgi:ribosomal-protein-alanine N-acetyltransferase